MLKNALDVIPRKIAPNPIVVSGTIHRDQLSDPEAIAQEISEALATAPPYAKGDLQGWRAHGAFVSKRLMAQFPPDGFHLLNLQCGTAERLQQSFIEFHPISNSLEVHLPQIKRADISQIKEGVGQLTQMLSNYYSEMLRLHGLSPGNAIGSDQSRMISAPLLERLRKLERNLATDGSKFQVSQHLKLFATNSPFSGLDLGTENALEEARIAFLRQMLGEGFDSPNASLQKEEDFWAAFPSSIAEAAPWYGDVPLKERAEDVCLVLKVRNIYPDVIRPEQLYTPLVSVNADESDLRGDLVAWYVVDKRSGRIIYSRLISDDK